MNVKGPACDGMARYGLGDLNHTAGFGQVERTRREEKDSLGHSCVAARNRQHRVRNLQVVREAGREFAGPVYQCGVAEDRIEVTAGRAVCGRCKMILLDPELEPDSASASANAKTSAASRPEMTSRIPSRRTLGRFLAQAQDAAKLSGQVTVLLTTDATIRDLNRRFRGKDEATDVLSFPAKPLQNTKPVERVAGDVAISVETARKQAAEQGHALGVELRVLILHGLLHLAGYDHETDAGRMQRRERQLRAKLELPLGLIERVSVKRTKTRRRKP